GEAQRSVTALVAAAGPGTPVGLTELRFSGDFRKQSGPCRPTERLRPHYPFRSQTQVDIAPLRIVDQCIEHGILEICPPCLGCCFGVLRDSALPGAVYGIGRGRRGGGVGAGRKATEQGKESMAQGHAESPSSMVFKRGSLSRLRWK